VLLPGGEAWDGAGGMTVHAMNAMNMSSDCALTCDNL